MRFLLRGWQVATKAPQLSIKIESCYRCYTMSQCWQHALYHVRILQFIHHQSPLDSVILLLTVSHAHAQYVTIQANLCLRSHFGHTPDLKHVLWKTKISNKYRGICSSHYTGCRTGHLINLLADTAKHFFHTVLRVDQTQTWFQHCCKIHKQNPLHNTAVKKDTSL